MKKEKIKRLQFIPGQRLYASDFQYIETFNREMRWRHNQSLHQYGIGSGFAVRGEIGEREVKIEPGYAIDSEGREIILPKIKVLPIPPVAGQENNKPAYYDLTVSYPDEIKLEEVETRQSICHQPGTVRLREEPNFCWVLLNPDNKEPTDDLGDEIRKGLKIIIMRAEIQNCMLSKKISIAQRRGAKPANKPYIISGSYVPNPSNIEWRLWPDQNGTTRPLGLKIGIDSSSANFKALPYYHAEIAGERYVDDTIDDRIDYYNYYPYILEGFINPNIPSQNDKPKLNVFNLLVLMPTMTVSDNVTVNPYFFFETSYENDQLRQKILNRLGWYVKWFGIEG